jgi:uncharacterized protein (DUF433 family)
MLCTTRSSGWAPETSRPLMKKAGGLLLRHVDRVANGQGVWYAGEIICAIHHFILPPDLTRLTIREHTVRSQRSHPYIDKRPGYRGGCAIIAGTNFPISSLAVYILPHGMLPEELVRRFPHLTLAQVYDALSYYYDHQAEVDAEIEKNLSQDAMAARLPRGELLTLRYDPATDHFVIQSLGKLDADPA